MIRNFNLEEIRNVNINHIMSFKDGVNVINGLIRSGLTNDLIKLISNKILDEKINCYYFDTEMTDKLFIRRLIYLSLDKYEITHNIFHEFNPNPTADDMIKHIKDTNQKIDIIGFDNCYTDDDVKILEDVSERISIPVICTRRHLKSEYN